MCICQIRLPNSVPYRKSTMLNPPCPEPIKSLSLFNIMLCSQTTWQQNACINNRMRMRTQEPIVFSSCATNYVVRIFLSLDLFESGRWKHMQNLCTCCKVFSTIGQIHSLCFSLSPSFSLDNCCLAGQYNPIIWCTFLQ